MISERISVRILHEFGRSGKEIIMTFKIIETNPSFTAEEIASKIGKTSRTVENHIQKTERCRNYREEKSKIGRFMGDKTKLKTWKNHWTKIHLTTLKI